MSSFESKPKLSIEECCRQFYDSSIFHAIVHDSDLWSGFLDIAFKNIVEVDRAFLSIDPTPFRKEMTALRMEMFGLAWSERFKRDKHTIPQSFFTRSYLEENGSLEIWEIMGEYNQAIAQSTTLTASGKQMEGRIGRARITQLNLSRANMFYEWIEANVGDPSAPTEEDRKLTNCVARVANRIGANTRREDDVVVKLLGSRLANRLGCDANLKSEALFRLSATIFGFYKGAEEYLKSVDLQG